MWGIFYPQESTKWNGTLRNKGKIIIIIFFKNNFDFEFVS
jgi:hypothetical protein